MKNLLYAYMAGFVDGEGTISIKSQSKQKPYYGYLSVCNTNYNAIKLFEQEFGGKVRKRNWSKNQKNVSKNWKPCYEWQLTCEKAKSAITILMPYLKLKYRQAMLVVRLLKLKKKYNKTFMRWHPEYRVKRDRVYSNLKEKCKILNKRGL